jgi:hypothetical protein
MRIWYRPKRYSTCLRSLVRGKRTDGVMIQALCDQTRYADAGGCCPPAPPRSTQLECGTMAGVFLPASEDGGFPGRGTGLRAWSAARTRAGRGGFVDLRVASPWGRLDQRIESASGLGSFAHRAGVGGVSFHRPLPKREDSVRAFHGLRVAREDAGCTLPAATPLRPSGQRRERKGWIANPQWLKPASGKPVETGWSGNWLQMGCAGRWTTAEAVAYERARALKRPRRRGLLAAPSSVHGVALRGESEKWESEDRR